MTIKKTIKASLINDSDFIGYRQAETNIYTRELSSISQDKMMDIAYWLWENYPLSKWIIEVIVSFVLAEGLPFSSKNEKIYKILWNFWYDSVNRMDLYFDKHLRELYIFGELCLPVKVSKANGRVRLGYIDPKQIKQVYVDPENVKIVIGVMLFPNTGKESKKYKTVLSPEIENFLSVEAKKIRDGFLSGEVFFFSINNVSNAPRGRSELLDVADWIDLYENYLYDYAEKWSQQNSFVWDITVKGANATEVTKQVKTLVQAVNKPGSAYGHNDSIELKALAPDLKSLDVDIGARIIRNHILGGKGFPSHWYGGGEDANKAVAGEMSVPTMKILSARQKYVKHILESIFDYQIEQAIKADRVNNRDLISIDNINKAYEIVTPELSPVDLGKFGAVIKNVADGLAVSESQQLLDKQTSREVLANVLSFLGKEIDVRQVEERLKSEIKPSTSKVD